jgi:two-component system, LuxR family, sensor kinase FixL
MLRLERVWDYQHRASVLWISGVIMLLVAVADWWTQPFVSLGFLYLFPIMLAAGFLPRWAIVLLGILAAILSAAFSSLDRSFVRLGFETLALAGCGLYVGELARNRRLNLQTEARLNGLVETSPAAIVTVDERGFVEIANRAANELLIPRGGTLVGHPIAAFFPELHHALRPEEAPHFRTSMQCLGHRGDGETFMADVWFSTYKESSKNKLAAIITVLEEQTASNGFSPNEGRGRPPLTSRETEVLRRLVQGLANKEIAAGLDISESAVKNALQQLFSKTNVRTRSQLVRVAVEQYRDLL